MSKAATACGVLAACFIGAHGVSAQLGPIPGQSVNMVSGTEWPDGDPFLQRQNEGSMAVSTRNPLHILGGGNDYRTVDIPGLPGGAMSGDAWNGVFWSRDGGHRWKSTLLPGYRQDMSPEGLASPIHGLEAGADPVIRAGANGMMFYVGIAFNRDAITESGSASVAGGGKTGRLFLARFIDDNARETGNPFRYLETLVVDSGNEGQFLDKPWLAVDKPRAGAGSCSIPGDGRVGPQSFPSGNVYVAYTTFVGKSAVNIRTKVMFARSTDCGRTWSQQKLSEGYPVNQGAVIAIEPNSGAVYVAWRRFRSDKGDPDGFLIAKSVDGGRSFTKATDLVTFTPYTLADGVTTVSRIFEQGTSIASFRTTGFPALTVDPTGVVYAAWAERGFGPMAEARIMMRRSGDGVTWTETAFPVDNPQPPDTPRPGHQLMPSLMFHAGRVNISYYNLAEDHTVGFLLPQADGAFLETREPAGDLAETPPDLRKVFNDFVADFAPAGLGKLQRRHTIDLWLGDGPPAPPGTAMAMETVRVSQYVYGHDPADASLSIRQFQFNPPNFPLFACQGELANCKAFFGDYIDLAGSPAMVPNGAGGWDFNTMPATSRVLHAIWTDNRDVRPPSDGISWHLYAPPNSPFTDTLGGASLFDPSQARPVCTPEPVPGFTRAGMRNQNLYTARITQGLVAGSPQNSKPLGLTTIDGQTVLLQRAFVVFVQNTTPEVKTFLLTIANQPADAPAPGRASFLQFATPGFPEPLTDLFVRVPPKSTATRTVFVTSQIENASVTVLVRETADVNAPPLDGGLSATVVLNPDITNPDITNPDITNPDITNPDITNAEVYNPDITNPDITNPDITNPDITNPDITNPDITNPDITNPDITNVQVHNPDITNPDITNPDITNPDITNPDITNPDITNPDITNGTVAEATWTIKDTGNTTGGYKVKLLVNGEVPADFKTQLILHRGHSTPVAIDCELAVQRQPILVANIPNPEFESLLSPDITNPDITNPDITNATLYVGPGDDWAQITLRIVDTLPGVGPTPEEFLQTTVTPVIVAQAVNTEDAVAGSTTPPVSVPPSRRLAFLVPPTGGAADEPIAPAVQVQVRDEFSRPVPGAVVTLAIGTGPEGAEIGGNQATSDARGIATFSELTLSPVGVYTIVASVPGEGAPEPAVTAPFLIAEACSLDGDPTFVHSVVEGPEAGSQPVASRAANFDGDPYPDLVVIHANGLITKMSGNGLGGFDRRFQFILNEGTFTGPVDVVVGDFNHDGLSDFAVSYPGEEAIGIVLSDVENADQYFTGNAATIPFTVEGGPRALAVGDFRTVFNAEPDGHLDLAVAATADNTVWILFGDGEGGFESGGSVADLFGPVALAAADMDADGLDDLVVANRGNALGSTVQVLLARLFYDDEVPAVDSDPAGVNPTSVAVADFNRDGHADVAVASAGGLVGGDDVGVSGDVRVLFGDSAGHLQAASLEAGTLVFLPGVPSSVAAAHLNRDGLPDLALANGENLLIAENGGGTFGSPLAFTAGNTPVHASVADVNGDGQTDVIVTNREPDEATFDTVSVLLTSCGGESADVAVTIEDSPDPVGPGEEITYVTTVTNHGPFTATGVTLTQSLGGALVSTHSTAGSCTNASPVVCDIGDLAPEASAVVTIVVTAPGEGPVTSRAIARAAETDRVPANNTATATTAVAGESMFVVTNTNDAGPGSLRQAMLDANRNAGFTDTILFDIDGEVPHVIALSQSLPAVIDPVLIDAPAGGDCDGLPPTIQIDGAETSGSGLVVTSGGTTIRGLSITGFPGSGIVLQGAGGNVVECSYVGVEPNGVTGRGNALDGIQIIDSAGNRLGGAAATLRNIISANGGEGVGVYGAAATGNVIAGNYIGTDASGAAALGNNASGVYIRRAPDNFVTGNVVSANNNPAAGFAGVAVCGSAAFCGGGDLGTPGSNASGNVIQGNRIGTDWSGTADLGNALRGVSIDGAPNTLVGGTDAAQRNVISGNGLFGVAIFGAGATGNQVLGNYIGTNAAGAAAIPNGSNGVDLQAGPNAIGGVAAGAGNVISGNAGNGILIAESAGSTVQGNHIGTDAAGTAAVPNEGNGVRIFNAHNTTVGGTVAGARNLISGNALPGAGTVGTSSGNVFAGNYIGTDVTGLAAIGNNGGVVINGDKNLVGGPDPASRNVISGNIGLGLNLSSGAGHTAQGNLIGTDATGNAPLPNSEDGLTLGSTTGSIVQGNVISGNGRHGIFVGAITADDNVIRGNAIGTNAAGTAALGNGGWGIDLFGGSGNTVGGSLAGDRNVIVDNALGGLWLRGASNNLVRGNVIGLPDRGNGGDGVRIDGSDNVVSGDPDDRTAPNEIRFNGGDGIRVVTGSGNSLRINRVDDNAGLGINLGGDGVTANDAGDGDAGPNGGQNFPELESATGDGAGGVTIRGALNTLAENAAWIDFFHSPSCDASGHGEGLTWFGALGPIDTGAGLVDFSSGITFLGVGVPDGASVTAIATLGDGSTSEFSACVGVQTSFVAVDLAPVGAGPFTEVPEDFNGTRGVTVTVIAETPVEVVSMTLDGLDIGDAETALVGARIYPDGGGEAIASGEANVSVDGSVTIPLAAPLASGASYRIVFFVSTSGPAGEATSHFLLPTTFGYQAAPPGLMVIQGAWVGSDAGDMFPGIETNRVPQITVGIKGS